MCHRPRTIVEHTPARIIAEDLCLGLSTFSVMRKHGVRYETVRDIKAVIDQDDGPAFAHLS